MYRHKHRMLMTRVETVNWSSETLKGNKTKIKVPFPGEHMTTKQQRGMHDRNWMKCFLTFILFTMANRLTAVYLNHHRAKGSGEP